MIVRYTVGSCSLGHVVVAATPRGLSAVALAKTLEELIDRIREMHPQWELLADECGLNGTLQLVIDQIETPSEFRLPELDLRGTEFQTRVWNALIQIPLGETRTYSQLAKNLGIPAAVRAVASACGANPVAILVPCHRVIGSDGQMRGYRWGVDRKRELLAREGVHSARVELAC
jgi:AraC family transcriptional regulator of adaptative response/methylated-DNA-[protein]-cysteine methyltransferase